MVTRVVALRGMWLQHSDVLNVSASRAVLQGDSSPLTWRGSGVLFGKTERGGL